MLFYEPKEEQRMGVKRVHMAAEAGANVMVTACPFCMVNLEDAIKVAGMEGNMTAIDLTELVAQQMVAESKFVEAAPSAEIQQEFVMGR
jgi:Fe-S oxidoreductase